MDKLKINSAIQFLSVFFGILAIIIDLIFSNNSTFFGILISIVAPILPPFLYGIGGIFPHTILLIISSIMIVSLLCLVLTGIFFNLTIKEEKTKFIKILSYINIS